MQLSRLFSILALSLTLLTSSAWSQVSYAGQKTAADNRAESTSPSKRETERLLNERRSRARSILISLANDALSFPDMPLRARCLARIADALWEADAEQARSLFRKSWASAETADRESKEPLRIRRQVLAVLGRRDRALAEELLQKLKVDLEDQSKQTKRSLWELPEALQQRLSLAFSMLRTGDTERALQFADPILNTVNISTIDFLVQLRDKDAVAADKRYAAMLMAAGTDPLADANTISLLASYIFTPQTYVVFNTVGAASYSWMRTTTFPPANVDSQLRLAFFQTGAAVLLRPQVPPDQDTTTCGIPGKYMVIKRLLPLFAQYAPKQTTDALLAQLEALNTLVSDELRQNEGASLRKGIAPEKDIAANQEKSLLDQIEHAKTSAQQDEAYLGLALLALDKVDVRARDYVSKIEDSEFREQAQRWIDWGLALQAVTRKQTDMALDIARKGDLAHIERVWVFTESAKLLIKTDHEQALSLITAANTEANRIEKSDLDRPRAFLAIANAVRLVEPARIWDALFDAVAAANSTDGFVGEGGRINLTFRSKGKMMTATEPIADFDIKGIFEEVANTDFDRGVELTRGFKEEAARANATIAICRSLLTQQNVSSTPPQPAKN